MSRLPSDSTVNPQSSLSRFSDRHIGPNADSQQIMLTSLGFSTFEDFLGEVVPHVIRLTSDLDLPKAISEDEALAELRQIINQNVSVHSLIGCGYYGTLTPGVIKRNILENPAW